MKRILLFLSVAGILAGCRTKERIVMVETVRTDTTYITKMQRDSIYLQDSIGTKESRRGDTVFVEVERLRRIYIERTKHDTLREATHDTILMSPPMEVKVEKPLTRWQRARIRLANMVLCGLGVGVVVLIIRMRKRFLP